MKTLHNAQEEICLKGIVQAYFLQCQILVYLEKRILAMPFLRIFEGFVRNVKDKNELKRKNEVFVKKE